MKYSSEIAQSIKKYLEEINMHRVAFDDKRGEFSFSMNIGKGLSFINVVIQVHEDDYSVLAICPVHPATEDCETMALIAEFVCRANYGLKNGCFEMDFRDGELRYKSFIDCDDQFPSQALIRNSIGCPVSMMKRYAPGILDVLFKSIDAETAVQECEKDQTEAFLRELKNARGELDDLLRRLQDTEESDELDKDGSAKDTDEDNSSEAIPSFEEFLGMMSLADPEASKNGNGEDSDEEVIDQDAV